MALIIDDGTALVTLPNTISPLRMYVLAGPPRPTRGCLAQITRVTPGDSTNWVGPGEQVLYICDPDLDVVVRRAKGQRLFILNATNVPLVIEYGQYLEVYVNTEFTRKLLAWWPDREPNKRMEEAAILNGTYEPADECALRLVDGWVEAHVNGVFVQRRWGGHTANDVKGENSGKQYKWLFDHGQLAVVFEGNEVNIRAKAQRRGE